MDYLRRKIIPSHVIFCYIKMGVKTLMVDSIRLMSSVYYPEVTHLPEVYNMHIDIV